MTKEFSFPSRIQQDSEEKNLIPLKVWNSYAAFQSNLQADPSQHGRQAVRCYDSGGSVTEQSSDVQLQPKGL